MIEILPNIEDAPFQNGILIRCKPMREAKRSNAEYQDYRSLRLKNHLAIGVEVLDLQEVVNIRLGLKLNTEKQPNRIHTNQSDYLSKIAFLGFFLLVYGNNLCHYDHSSRYLKLVKGIQ